LIGSGGIYEDCYVAKYSNAGNVLWAKSAGGKKTDKGQSVSAGKDNTVYVTGNFYSDSIYFNNFFLINFGSNSSDIFIAKYDSIGNIIWLRSGGGTNSDGATAISINKQQDIFITGSFWSSVINFDNRPLYNTGLSNVFIAKYNSSGNIIYAQSAIGSMDNRASSICNDSIGNVYLTGGFSGAFMIFGNDTIHNNGTGTSTDIFIAKIDTNFISTGINEQLRSEQVKVFPNPATDKLYVNIASNAKAEISLLDVCGREIKRTQQKEIDVKDLNEGIYFVQIKTAEGTAVKKIVVQH
jgi:hypothetical protein